ncbi:MAG: orc1/cdc6 family replication initiation protein [Candidatus Lokiarchaeota archaeon]|nr:orc1/cdc6 family replication initiation protein [Candidatus Lokiarchaeota archaeon]
MIAKSNLNNNYIGTKALFDPNFIPPRLLYRKKEEDSLFSILNDSISDEFCLNILYQGINGIGKKAVINKVLNDLLNQNKDFIQINNVFVDCKEKNIEEVIFSLLSEIITFSNINIDLRSILNSNISNLWNTFKFISNKVDSHLFFIFNNIEYLEPEIFNKFLQFSREANITLISTANKIIRPGTIDLLSEFDFKNRLNFFTYHELYAILKQRVLLSFSHEIDNQLIQYITDLICEQYVPVPGKGIDILRDIYPILKNKNNISNFELLEICQNEFDNFQISDEFSMFYYLSEEDILTVIFLDNLSNYFMRKMNYYISLEELQELYEISCETLEYNKNFNEFRKLTEELLNIGIIKTSKQTLSKFNTHNSLTNVNNNLFFILINPKQIKVIIDTIFNQ